MKNFTFKLLQQLNKKRADKGFTLIELLVVIIIIGILSAIALPAFLNQASKAKQSEAKQTLGALNRGQQAYRLEKPAFANTIDALALGVETDTNNYFYGATASNEGSFGTVSGTMGVVSGTTAGVTTAGIYALADDNSAVRSYSGAAATSTDSQSNATTITILCEGTDPADRPEMSYGGTPAALACGGNSTEL